MNFQLGNNTSIVQQNTNPLGVTKSGSNTATLPFGVSASNTPSLFGAPQNVTSQPQTASLLQFSNKSVFDANQIAPAPFVGLSNATSSNSGFSFGNSTGVVSAPQAYVNPTPSGFSLGNITASSNSATGFSVGNATTTAGLSFGISSTFNTNAATVSSSTPTSLLRVGLGGTPAQTAVPATTGSVFGNLGTSSTTAPSLLTTATKPGGGFTLGSSVTSSAPVAPTTTFMGTPTVNKGLGGTLATESGATTKSEAMLKEGAKQAKDMDLHPELKQTVDVFKKYLNETKKSCDEIKKSNELVGLLQKVKEDSRSLSQSISEVTDGLQMIQIQSSKLKSDLNKEQSNIKVAQTTNDSSFSYSDQDDSVNYLAVKMTEFESRLVQYQREVELVEGMLATQHSGSVISPRDLVQIIRRVEEDFISVAAQVYAFSERVRRAKADYMRRLRASGVRDDPFKVLEGRFCDPLEAAAMTSEARRFQTKSFFEDRRVHQKNIGAISQAATAQASLPSTAPTKGHRHHRISGSECVGGSPFEHSRYSTALPIAAPVSSSNLVPSGIGAPVFGGGAMLNKTLPITPAAGGLFANPLPTQAASPFGTANTNNNIFQDSATARKRR